MAKIVNISEIHPTLGFTEFDILKNSRVLIKLHSVFPVLNVWQKPPPVGPAPGTQEQIQSFRKDRPMVLKAYTGFSDRQLRNI